jgi:predicted metal-dependent hydrolase
MADKIINLDGVEVTFFKSNKAKNINISIKPNRGVRVSVPRFVSFKNAERFAYQKIGWMKKHLSKIQSLENNTTIFDLDTKFSTKKHQLLIVKKDLSICKTIIKDGLVKVLVPISVQVSSTDSQAYIRQAIEHAWRKEAKELLPTRTAELAQIYGFNYAKVAIRNSKTRWGSCSYNNNINLSLHLMMLPDHLIDYVILHELAHTKEKNHGIHFWKLLDEVSGNARSFDKEVKQYRIGVY